MVRCTLRKVAVGIPSMITISLITYISWTFQVRFLPEKFKDNPFGFVPIALHLVFSYFSLMTYAHLFRCLLADPGYVPEEYKAPLKMPEKLAPLELVRLYNVRSFSSNKIYSFDNLGHNPGDVGGDDSISASVTTSEESINLIRPDQPEAIDIEMAPISHSGNRSLAIKKPSFPVDMENLCSVETRIYNMRDEEWRLVEDDYLEKFPKRTWSLVQWRYCFKCKHVRPPRAHHCSICDACVVRMDHHCPWVGNCVGLHNHKYFLNFLFNAMAGCLTAAATMIHSAFNESFRRFDRDVHNAATMMLSTALIFSLGGLLGLHSYLIATNQSTLEMQQLNDGNPFNRTKLVQKTSADKKIREPLRLFVGKKHRQTGQASAPVANSQKKRVTDYMKNVQDVMGQNPNFWAWPFEPSGGMANCDGLYWSLSEIH